MDPACPFPDDARPPRHGVYLNDHLTGAFAGTSLAERIARTHDNADESGLTQLAADIAADRDALIRIMRGLDLRPARERKLLMQAGEMLGRLKPNGSWTRRTALTDVVELELMAVAVAGKTAGWRSLRALAEDDQRVAVEELDTLLERAEAQSVLIEDLRRRLALRAFGGSEPAPG